MLPACRAFAKTIWQAAPLVTTDNTQKITITTTEHMGPIKMSAGPVGFALDKTIPIL